jgi:hypothetical protein
MKTIALIGLILVTTASMGMAAETSVTIQNHTTMRIDSITGKIKGDAQTQVRGINKHEAPQAVNTLPGEGSSAEPTAVGTPVTPTTPANPTPATTPTGSTTPANPTPVTIPVPATTPISLGTTTTPVGAIPPGSTTPPCPLRPVVVGLQN